VDSLWGISDLKSWRTGSNASSYSCCFVISNSYFMISEDKAYEIIVELYAREKTFKEIAKEFKVSNSLIGEINRGFCHKMDNYSYPIRGERLRC